MKVTAFTRRALRHRRDDRDREREGWEFVGVRGGRLWELWRGGRQEQMITAVRIAADGRSLWIKTGPRSRDGEEAKMKTLSERLRELTYPADVIKEAADELERLEALVLKSTMCISDEVLTLKEHLCRAEKERDKWREAERRLSAVYLRIRGKLGSTGNVPSPCTPEQVWKHTEDCLDVLLGKLAEVDAVIFNLAVDYRTAEACRRHNKRKRNEEIISRNRESEDQE